MRQKYPEVPIPKNMQSLPTTDKGYKKPWFVESEDFRVVDKEKAICSINLEACWICGNSFIEGRYALVGSPLSAMFRNFREPPCHVECAEYSMQVCPFLLYPSAKRRYAGLEEVEDINKVNEFLDVKTSPENTGEHYIVVVSGFEFDPIKFIMTCSEEQVLERQYWVEGKLQEEVPNPIVEFDELPDYIKKELIDTGQMVFPYDLALPNHSISDDVQTVTLETHRDKSWRQPSAYYFAKRDCLARLAANELPNAMHSLPTAFVESGGQFELVAVLGLKPDQNLFVGATGTWLNAYLPEIYSVYPFVFGSSDNNKSLLCVDESSGLIDKQPSHITEESFQFFSHEQLPSDEIVEVQNKLKAINRGFKHASRISNVLSECDLLKPWTIRVGKIGTSRRVQLNGLFCVNEERLNGVDGNMLVNLRDTGALLVAYCQLLSMKQLEKLAEIK